MILSLSGQFLHVHTTKRVKITVTVIVDGMLVERSDAFGTQFGIVSGRDDARE